MCRSAEALRGRDLYLFDLDHFHRLQAEDEAEALPAEQWRNPHMPDLPQELRETHLVIDARTQVRRRMAVAWRGRLVVVCSCRL